MTIKRLVLSILSAVTIALFCSYIFLLQEGEYKEDNRLKYHLITPSVIANVPRVTHSYFFSYTPDDNYGYERYAIYFEHVEDYQQAIDTLNNYVINQREKLDTEVNDLTVTAYNDKTKLTVTLLEYTNR
ncbi:hypothetical protein [Enterobacillus tribolii]|uniref:Uncharacterized protein n=1 Tax=Enterobacillus tribolii TaxID=1487935 RepID=A0A370QSB7_9GAMM|nr:hypothetical protein [Enterobacillus tribolii]MBW7983771.1 hypothetical protein [Enterobacillus tribolii]RDK92136.1 hypothetical protein C8D90_104294 [Enterobacillus tribolii]